MKIEIDRLNQEINELKAERKSISSLYDILVENNTTLRAENARYREALEFYADRNSWKFYSYSNDCKDMIEFSDVGVKSYNEVADYACGSGGRRAREALKGIE